MKLNRNDLAAVWLAAAVATTPGFTKDQANVDQNMFGRTNSQTNFMWDSTWLQFTSDLWSGKSLTLWTEFVKNSSVLKVEYKKVWDKFWTVVTLWAGRHRKYFLLTWVYNWTNFSSKATFWSAKLEGFNQTYVWGELNAKIKEAITASVYGNATFTKWTKDLQVSIIEKEVTWWKKVLKTTKYLTWVDTREFWAKVEAIFNPNNKGSISSWVKSFDWKSLVTTKVTYSNLSPNQKVLTTVSYEANSYMQDISAKVSTIISNKWSSFYLEWKHKKYNHSTRKNENYVWIGFNIPFGKSQKVYPTFDTKDITYSVSHSKWSEDAMRYENVKLQTKVEKTFVPNNKEVKNNAPEILNVFGTLNLTAEEPVALVIAWQDKDKDKLTYRVDNLPVGLTLVWNRITWSISQPGEYQFIVYANDGKESSIWYKIKLKVSEAPVKITERKEKIPYNTINQNDPELEEGHTRVEWGIEWEKKIITKTYIWADWKEKIENSEVILKNPVDKIIYTWTKQVNNWTEAGNENNTWNENVNQPEIKETKTEEKIEIIYFNTLHRDDPNLLKWETREEWWIQGEKRITIKTFVFNDGTEKTEKTEVITKNAVDKIIYTWTKEWEEIEKIYAIMNYIWIDKDYIEPNSTIKTPFAKTSEQIINDDKELLRETLNEEGYDIPDDATIEFWKGYNSTTLLDQINRPKFYICNLVWGKLETRNEVTDIYDFEELFRNITADYIVKQWSKILYTWKMRFYHAYNYGDEKIYKGHNSCELLYRDLEGGLPERSK